ncbi:MAG: 30S ribosomal protein S19 [Candidatus Nanoarchaeia archaeon]|nr:30S ribosomal protein S19 [Candidatus Nanoarchaeia archaeon]MDD5239668.1 30S ribosomal protein S19 [Candidatus Nanoarchaeia archaeon]
MAELRKFQYKGFAFEDLKRMEIKDFMKIIPARPRRSLTKGFTEQQKIFVRNLKRAKAELEAGREPKIVKTHCRDMVVIPLMIGLQLGIYDGREFVKVEMKPDMLGHYLGEFTYNRKRVQHHSPGIGATRGSAFVAVK